LAVVWLCLVGVFVAYALPTPKDVLNSGVQAANYYVAHDGNILQGCGWKRGTFMLGLIKFRNALVRLGLPADTYNKILFDWANHYNWKICTEDGNKTPHNPDNQLCGSTYIELFLLDGQTNKTWIEDTVKVIDSEASGSFPQKWTWVDTLFMSMNTWSRVYQVLKSDTYSTTQAALFDTTRVGEHFWNITEQLWYRDARYLKTDVFLGPWKWLGYWKSC